MEFNCPICGKKVVKTAKNTEKSGKSDFFPFCSQRCKLIDLNVWFEGGYVISSPIRKDENNDDNSPENKLE